MAAFYHSHNNTTTGSTEIPDHHHHASNLHTLFLMNPNLAPPPHHHHHGGGYDDHPPQPPPQPSHNILLLNSAAAAASFSHSPQPLPHQFVRVPAGEQNNVMLYGYPQEEARDMSRARQGLSLSLSSQNQAYGRQDGGAEFGSGQMSVYGSKYLKAAQELLEEVVHVGDGLVSKNNDDDNDQSPKKGKGVGDTVSEEREKQPNGGDSGGVQLSMAERHEVQMKKAKLATMLDEAEQRYRQYHNQMQIVIESFERAAGMGSAKTYTALALKTISKQFRCLKDAIQGQIRTANKSLGEDEGGSSAGKIEGSRLKFIDHQIRQQRALQQLGMIQNHNAWRPQRGLPERSVSVLRAWLFEHFLHPYPKDSDKIMLAKQTGLTRSQVSNWFINARVRLWKPMIEEMYNEELKEHERNASGDKSSSKEISNDDAGASNSINNQEHTNIADTQITATKDQNNGAINSSSAFMSMPTSSPTPYKVNHLELAQNQHGFTFTGSLDMEGLSQASPKRQRSNDLLLRDNGRNNNGEILIKFGNDHDDQKPQQRDNGYPIISEGMNFLGGGELGSYGMGEIGRLEAEDFPPARFLQGNGISLSLGLPPSCDNHHQQFNNLSATNQHSFMTADQNMHQFRRGNDFGPMGSPSSHSSAAGFECIDIQNRKGFAAQLLPDFVA